MKKQAPHIVHSISEQHRILALPKPKHPLVSVFNFEQMDHASADTSKEMLVLDMYCISLKRNVTGKVRYGQGFCDFDEGVMFCTAPGQVTGNITEDHKPIGWCAVFHPDFIRRHPLGQRIKDYGFFDYAVNEALHLSEQEETLVISVMAMLRDLLKNLTGQNTQQQIHRYVIEKAKALLTQTDMTVSEIGFRLGFEFPQSFSRLFKSKTSMTPLNYRRSLN